MEEWRYNNIFCSSIRNISRLQAFSICPIRRSIPQAHSKLQRWSLNLSTGWSTDLVSGFLETSGHDVSETGSVSVFTASLQWLMLAVSKLPNRGGVSPSHLRMETDPVSETSCSLVSRIPDEGQSPQTQQFWVLYTIVRTLYRINLLKTVLNSEWSGSWPDAP
jgi:hypothetical protein